MSNAATFPLITGGSGLGYQLARCFAKDGTLGEHAGLDPRGISVLSGNEMAWRAPRPADASLGSARGGFLSETLPAMDRFPADTRHAAKKKTPHPSPF